VVEGLVDAELGEVLADVVDDLLELAVEFKGFRDEAVVGITDPDRGLGAAGDDDGEVRCQADDEALGDARSADNFDAADAFDLLTA
jgi:hypothetical protein